MKRKRLQSAATVKIEKKISSNDSASKKIDPNFRKHLTVILTFIPRVAKRRAAPQKIALSYWTGSREQQQQLRVAAMRCRALAFATLKSSETQRRSAVAAHGSSVAAPHYSQSQFSSPVQSVVTTSASLARADSSKVEELFFKRQEATTSGFVQNRQVTKVLCVSFDDGDVCSTLESDFCVWQNIDSGHLNETKKVRLSFVALFVRKL